MKTPMIQSGRHSRGAALLLVLIAVAVLTILALSFLASQQPTAAVAKNIDNKAKARVIAESALKMAIDYVNEDPTWRTDKTNGTWMSSVALDGGTFDLYGTDEDDGDLADDSSDPVHLVAVATYQGVTHRVTAIVTPADDSNAIAGRLLFVVSDATSLSSLEQARQTLLESWDYVVTPIDDDANQTQIDAAVAESHVVYISATVDAASVGNAFVNAAIGVVNENPYLCNDLGFTAGEVSSSNTSSATQAYLFDYSDAITKGLSPGVRTIADTAVDLHYVDSSPAWGVWSLADQSGAEEDYLLMMAEAGATLYTGAAAGRRVMWGFAATMDVTDLSTDGQTLLRRSIQWASGFGLHAKWFYDVGWISTLAAVDWTQPPDQETFEAAINWVHGPSAWWSGAPVNQYGVELTGSIWIPATGNWTFYLSSDDGSELVVDGTPLVDHDGLHGMTERTGTIALTQGQVVSIRVRFFERNSYQGLILSWSGPDQSKEVVPESAFFPLDTSGGSGQVNWDEPD